MTTSNYNNQNNQDNSWMGCAFWIGAVLAVLLSLCFLHSCSPRIVEHISYQRDTTYIKEVQVDSVYKRDSVYVREKGDTIYIYKEKVRDRYKLLRDTIRVVRVDSVAVERIKEVQVAAPLSWWQKAKIRAFWWLAGAVLLLALWVFRKPLLKLIKYA